MCHQGCGEQKRHTIGVMRLTLLITVCKFSVLPSVLPIEDIINGVEKVISKLLVGPAEQVRREIKNPQHVQETKEQHKQVQTLGPSHTTGT